MPFPNTLLLSLTIIKDSIYDSFFYLHTFLSPPTPSSCSRRQRVYLYCVIMRSRLKIVAMASTQMARELSTMKERVEIISHLSNGAIGSEASVCKITRIYSALFIYR